jgi:phosphoesterase RecJ-like protein
MIHTDPATAAPAFASILAPAKRILLLTHINPDGDAIGSMLALWHVLTDMGKTPFAVASSELPSYTEGLPGIEHVQVYHQGMALPEVDLIWMVDTATLTRVGRIHDDYATWLSDRPLLIVDHHVTNTGEGTLNLIAPGSASTADLLYRLFRAIDVYITPVIATCLLMGLTTDTQSFQTSSTNPQALRTAAELLEAGADHHAVMQAVYYSTPYSTLQLVGMALSQLQQDGDLVWTNVSWEMLRATGAEDEASDDIVNRMQRMAGMRACALFKERADGTTKISLRSKPGLDVAMIATIWGGGGHTQAAGATLLMGLEEAQREVLPRLREALGRTQ